MAAHASPHGEPQPAAAAGALDRTVLEQLRVDLEDDDGSDVASLVSIYLDSAQTLIPDLAEALRSGDTASAARYAHALVSPSALVGAGPLGDLLQRVQADAHDRGIPTAQLAALAETIAHEGDRVVVALAQLAPTDTPVVDLTY